MAGDELEVKYCESDIDYYSSKSILMLLTPLGESR